MGILSACKSVAFGLAVCLTFIDNVGFVARVDGVSMHPTLNRDADSKDWVFLNRWAARDFQVYRGDIVCLASPKDPKQLIIKRVIGLQGDVIRTTNAEVGYIRVPEGHCWVEGDNRTQSMDSNFFGPVAVALISAKATAIVWPPQRWATLDGQAEPERRPL